LMGFAAARSAALSTRVFEALDDAGGRDRGMDLPAFWRHCLAVACAAEMLAPLLNLTTAPEEAFVCGLLHDIGKLALLCCLPKSYARALEAARAHNASFSDYERRVIGVDHSVFGRRLAEQWRLPEAVQQVIWLHHQPPEAIPESLADRRLILAVGLADAIARQQRLGSSDNYALPRSVSQAAAQLGLAEQAVAAVIGQLSARVEERAALLGLGEAGGELLYRQALAGANAELGRLNEQLRRRADKLGRQAKAFRHMRDFVASLRPDAVVGEILIGIAHVTASVTSCSPSAGRPVVAYSISEDDKTLLAVRYDGSDSWPWRSLALADGFDAGAAEDEPAAAGEVVSALLADPGDLGEWVAIAACEHQGLICAGRWVGGVFYPAPGPAAAGARETVEICRAVASAVALALGIAQGRAKAMLLSEQLAGASQILAETQEALAEARALAAVGEMAAGAAHELNTPLAVISGRAQLMRERAAKEDERKVWQLIAEQAHRITDVLSELMEFASPQPAEPEALDVSALLKEAAAAFSSSGHPQAGAARVDISIGPGTPPVSAGRRQLCGALVELIRNAAMACARHGEIRLTAEHDELNDAVLLAVRDTGVGMDETTAAGAFTPFFSQQKAGRRLGMGLPKARRYVEMNGGSMWLDSRAGEGTTVWIRLPAARENRKPGGA
ncbi:MAG TPA: HDOD domain-containing protein, partial [Phycisphaerae bacterium]|nr:HDOD domain-containing protein [Phycisphaerae bacterium]